MNLCFRYILYTQSEDNSYNILVFLCLDCLCHRGHVQNFLLVMSCQCSKSFRFGSILISDFQIRDSQPVHGLTLMNVHKFSYYFLIEEPVLSSQIQIMANIKQVPSQREFLILYKSGRNMGSTERYQEEVTVSFKKEKSNIDILC